MGVDPGHRRLEVADVVGARAAVAPAPALDLTAHVAVAPVELGEPGGLDVDVVQRDESVDRGAAQRGHPVAVEPELRGHVAAQDGALEALHDVELRPDDVVVAAEGDHPRHRGEHRGQGGLDVVLAPHVVGAPGLGARRRATQDEVTPRHPAHRRTAAGR